MEVLLLENKHFEVRESFGNLLKTAINVTAKNEQSYFNEEISYLQFSVGSAPDFPTVRSSQSAVVRFMQYFFGELLEEKVRKNWRRYEEYFEVLKDFTQLSFMATNFMVNSQSGIYKLLEFCMNNKAPFSNGKVKMGESGCEPPLAQPLDVLSFLVRSTLTQGISASSQYAPTSVYQSEDKHISLPNHEILYLLQSGCIRELLRLCGESFSENTTNCITGIATHLSWGDNNVSQFFVVQIVDYLKYQVNLGE